MSRSVAHRRLLLPPGTTCSRAASTGRRGLEGLGDWTERFGWQGSPLGRKMDLAKGELRLAFFGSARLFFFMLYCFDRASDCPSWPSKNWILDQVWTSWYIAGISVLGLPNQKNTPAFYATSSCPFFSPTAFPGGRPSDLPRRSRRFGGAATPPEGVSTGHWARLEPFPRLRRWTWGVSVGRGWRGV